MPSEPLEIRVPVIADPAPMAAMGNETAKTTERVARLNQSIQEYLQKNDALILKQKSYAEQQAKIAELTQKYYDAQKKAFEDEERAWRQMQATNAAALKDEERIQGAIIKAREKALNAAKKGNEDFANSVRQWVQNPLQAAGNAAGDFALQYGKLGVGILGIGAAAVIAGKQIYDLTRQVGA